MIIKDVNLETVCGITSKLPANTQPEIKRRQIVPDQCADEPPILCENILAAGQDPDDQFLPYQRRVLLRRSARVRLRARERRGQGKVGQDD